MRLFTANSPVKPLYGVNAKPNHMVAYFGNKTLYVSLKRLIMFQRRHYKKMAEMLARWRDINADIVNHMINMFSRDNGNFDAVRFAQYFLAQYKSIWGEDFSNGRVL